MSSITVLPLRARRLGLARKQQGWKYWNSVWAAWCPTCQQECVPMPSGICGFCDTALAGQPTREWDEPPLTAADAAEAAAAQERLYNENYLVA